PIFAFLISFNISLRYKEILTYYLNADQIIDRSQLAVSNEDFANQWASFINSLDKNVEFYEDAGYQRDAIFDDIEGEVLLKLKEMTNFSVIIVAAMLLLFVIISIYYRKKDDLLNFNYVNKKSIIMQTVEVIVIICFFVITSIRDSIFDYFIGFSHISKDGNLHMICSGDSFSSVFNSVTIFLGVVFTIGFWALTNRLTTEKHMFKRRRHH
ncbi:MAG: hypothetical protein HUJ63_00805, partial [Enterococcus sp.]|nr:hypothetical protein [Enterococcus sp.]